MPSARSHERRAHLRHLRQMLLIFGRCRAKLPDRSCWEVRSQARISCRKRGAPHPLLTYPYTYATAFAIWGCRGDLIVPDMAPRVAVINV